jgi:RHS repeat-associated protein
MTVDTTGTVVGYDDYYPYGMVMTGRSSTSSADGRYKFTGKERDASDGLDYFGARYYDQWRGGWDQVDPMADANGGVSPYNYCSNNPIGMIDQKGLFPTKYLIDGVEMPNSFDPEESFGLTKMDWINLNNPFLDPNQRKNQTNQINQTIHDYDNWILIDYYLRLINLNNSSNQEDALILLIIWKESTLGLNINPSFSAKGVMQVTKTAFNDVQNNYDFPTKFSFTDIINNPQLNVMVGTAYLQLRIDRAGGNLRNGLFGYGDQTDSYVNSILDAFQNFKNNKLDLLNACYQIHR